MDGRPHGQMKMALERCRRHFVAAAVFSALLNLLYVAPTLYMLQVYDRVVPTRGVQTLLFLTIALVLALGTLASLDLMRVRLLARASAELDRALAPRLLDAVIGRPGAPEARQAVRDADQLRWTMTGPGVIALFDAPWLPIYVLVCFLVHPWIGVTALAGGVTLPLIAYANERSTRPRLEQAQHVAADTYARQDAVLDGADAVRALGMRRALVTRQLRERSEMLALQTQAALVGGGYVTLTKFTRLLLQSVALGVGAWLAVDNKISAGAIFASSFLIARALAPIEQLVGTWRSLDQARGTYRRLDDLLSSAGRTRTSTVLPPPRGALRLEDVTVLNAARDAAMIGGVSLSIEAGEVVAIVGPSGAGKSTLARLIAGAALPNRGTIRVDGADTRDWDPERLAPYVGYLPQAPTLFAGTIAENIARFLKETDEGFEGIDDLVVAAADAVDARTLIQRLPGGFDHRLGLGGSGLSAGQAQRIALARAVYGEPSLLVLDEPNAHLDSEGDVALLAAIARLKAAGRTVLVVSHKLSILPVVDKIMVLNAGRLIHFDRKDVVLARLNPNARRKSEAGAHV